MNKDSQVSNQEGVIKIPVGRYLGRVRENPWIVSTFVLAIVLIVVFISSVGSSTKTVTGNVISGDDAAKKLVSFINAQGKGDASFVSSTQEGSLYKVTVNYQGQDVPVYVTLDGDYLVGQPIPLTNDANSLQNSNTENTGDQEAGAKVNVDVGDSPVLGNKNASITIIEFSDYQCPFCEKFWTETLPSIKKDYIDTGKAKIVFKDFPLYSIHPNAEKAAEAARCVKEQKGDTGYFKMHDKLFANQESLSVENEKKWARELGVDGAKFDTCLDSNKFANSIKADSDYGQQLGVSGTPSFFVNGQALVGAQPYSAFKQIIDAELTP